MTVKKNNAKQIIQVSTFCSSHRRLLRERFSGDHVHVRHNPGVQRLGSHGYPSAFSWQMYVASVDPEAFYLREPPQKRN